MPTTFVLLAGAFTAADENRSTSFYSRATDSDPSLVPHKLILLSFILPLLTHKQPLLDLTLIIVSIKRNYALPISSI